jgi:hypothetical protein
MLKITEIGRTINDDPVVKFLLEVTPSQQPHFQAEAEQLISRLDIPQFQAGNAYVDAMRANARGESDSAADGSGEETGKG